VGEESPAEQRERREHSTRRRLATIAARKAAGYYAQKPKGHKEFRLDEALAFLVYNRPGYKIPSQAPPLDREEYSLNDKRAGRGEAGLNWDLLMRAIYAAR
jgi:hypothetical protein